MHNAELRGLRLWTDVFAGDVPALVPRHLPALLLALLADGEEVLLVPSGDVRAVVEGPQVGHVGMREVLLVRYGHEYLLCVLVVILAVGSAIHLARKEVAQRGVTLLQFLIKPISIPHRPRSLWIIIFIIEVPVLFALPNRIGACLFGGA